MRTFFELSLLALLLALAPTSRATDLVVKVVDKEGKPVAGVQVGLFSQAAVEGFQAPAMAQATSTSDELGLVRFTDAEKQISPDVHMKYFVRLGVPAAKDIDAEIDPKKLAESSPTLTLPECGSVLLRVPTMGKARAGLLRAADETGPGENFRFGGEPPIVKVEKGLARFEHVGLGIELEFEVTSPELPTPLTGKFRGPTKKGEAVEFRVPGSETRPGLLVTLVDENLAPIHGAPIDFDITIYGPSSSSSQGGRIQPDEAGHARIPLSREQQKPGNRLLSIYAPRADPEVRNFDEIPVEIDLPEDFTTGELDLGRILLAPAGSPKRFLLDDDAALQSRYEALLAKVRSGSTSRREAFELLLVEIVRRGGPRWEAFVEAQLKAVRDPANEGLRGGGPGDLELLTALRRLQGKPDPMRVIPTAESVLDVTFPDGPELAFELKNIESGESFQVTRGGSYRSGRFARCSVEAIAPGGKRLPPREWGSGFGGGMYSTQPLAPGESIALGIPLANYVEFSLPGEYRVRVHYHDKQDIDSAKDLAGRMYSSSDEFVVHVTPRRIELTQARLDELRGFVRTIDVKKAVILVSGHWHEGLTFSGEAVDPEDKLFRAGWPSVAALGATLQDKTIEPERRAWVFGMLWNILGLENPGTHARVAALGTIRWDEKWATSNEEAHSDFGEFGKFAPMKIDPAKQEELTRAWLDRLRLFEVKIVP